MTALALTGSRTKMRAISCAGAARPPSCRHPCRGDRRLPATASAGRDGSGAPVVTVELAPIENTPEAVSSISRRRRRR